MFVGLAVGELLLLVAVDVDGVDTDDVAPMSPTINADNSFLTTSIDCKIILKKY